MVTGLYVLVLYLDSEYYRNMGVDLIYPLRNKSRENKTKNCLRLSRIKLKSAE